MSSWNNQDKNLDILQNIEFFLVKLYERNKILKDSEVVMGLEYAEILIYQKQGFSKGRHVDQEGIYGEVIMAIIETYEFRMELDNIDWNTFIGCLKQVRNSVERHRQHGIRGYYEFIKNFVK